MTVSTIVTRNDAIASSPSQSAFLFDFQILEDSNLVAYVNGAKVNDGAYNITLNSAPQVGGTVTFVTAVPASQKVSLVLEMPLDRTTNYQNSGDFLASDVNADFDKIYLGAIQNENFIARGLVLQQVDPTPKVGGVVTDMTLPLTAARLDRILAFDPVYGLPVPGPRVPDITGPLTFQATLKNGNISGGTDVDITTGDGITTLNSNVRISAFLDEDNMASNSATALATQQSIKAYVDSAVGLFDTLKEVLANGNITDGNNIVVSNGDEIHLGGQELNNVRVSLSGTAPTDKDLATALAIKTYVDDETGNQDLQSVLVNGKITNGNDIVVSNGDTITVDNIVETTVDTGVTIEQVKLEDGTIVGKSIQLITGTTVSDISTDETLAGDSDNSIVTEKAIKKYVDDKAAETDSLSEVLALGNTTGGTNIVLTSNDGISIQNNAGGSTPTVVTMLSTTIDASVQDTNVPSSLAIKNYVDNEVAKVDELDEVLAAGNTSGGTDLIISAGDTLEIKPTGKFSLNAQEVSDIKTTVDQFASNTQLITALAVKNYVEDNNELSEVLANGNSTGANDIVVTSGQKITVDSITETSLASGVDVEGVVLKDGGITLLTGETVDNIDKTITLGTSDTALATQKAIKTYVDVEVAKVPIGDITAVNTTAPLSGGGVSGDLTLQISKSNTTTDGYLSSTDWNTFNNKSDTVGTVTSISATHAGDAFGVNGVPITSSGTINITMAGNSAQYINGEGNLISFPNIPQGTVTSVGASITGDSISIANSPVTTSGTLDFSFDGASTDYIDGEGNLTTFPAIPQGDITEVTVTAPINGGGTSGSVDIGIDIADDGTFASTSSTTVASTLAIKTYVDSQVVAQDELKEVLAVGNVTGGNDIVITAGDGINLRNNSAGTTTITDILVTGNMSSATNTDLVGALHIKSYIDNEVAKVDELDEVLAAGNTSGANDLIIESPQTLEIEAGASFSLNTKEVSDIKTDMTFASNTQLITALAVKTYVDDSGGKETLSETLALGNTSGANNIEIADGQYIQFGTNSNDCLTIRNTASGDKEITETGNGNLKIKADYFEFVDSSDNKMLGTDSSADITIYVGGTDEAFKTSQNSVDVIGRPLRVNDINEYTTNHGVEIENVLLKDGTIILPDGNVITDYDLSDVLSQGNDTGGYDINLTASSDLTLAASSEINFESGKYKIYYDGDSNLSSTDGDLKYFTTETGKGHKWYTDGVGGTGTSMSLSDGGTLSVDANVNATGATFAELTLSNSNGSHKVENFNTSTTLTGFSNTNVPTTAAIKSYVDTAVASIPVGDITNVSVTAPITGGGASGDVNIGINQASTTQSGYLSSTDWNTFNNKSDTVGTVTSVGISHGGDAFNTGSAVTSSGTLSITMAGTSAQYINGLGNLVTFPTDQQGVTSVASSIDGNAIDVSGTPITSTGTLEYTFQGTSSQYVNGAGNLVTFPTDQQGVTSVGLSVGGNALQVSGSPVTSTGTLTVTPQGTASQYINGAGNLTTFPNIPQGTVTSVASTVGGNALGVTGSPITSSGTLAYAWSGSASQYVNGAGNLVTFPTDQQGVTSVAQTHQGNAFTVTGSPITSTGTLGINVVGSASQYINGAGNLVTFPSVSTEGLPATLVVDNRTDGSDLNVTAGDDITFDQGSKAIFNNSFEIYRDASNSIIEETGTGSLIIRGTNLFLQSDDDNNYIQCVENGAVTLYHQTGNASAPKLATTSAGVNITGKMESDSFYLGSGATVSTISTSVGTSNTELVTSGAVKAYVDPLIPSVGNGTLTITTSGIASGGGTFTANQSGNSSINIAVTAPTPPTVGNGTLTVTAGTSLSGGGSFTANQSGNSSVTLNIDTPADAGSGGWYDIVAWNNGLVKDTSVELHGAGYFRATYLNMTHGVGTRLSDTVFYSSTDDYIRKTNATGMRSSLDVYTKGEVNALIPSIPTVNNSTITLAAGTNMTGGGAFTLNQSNNETITFNSTATGGNESLEQTLAIGSYSGSNDIKIKNDRHIQYGDSVSNNLQISYDTANSRAEIKEVGTGGLLIQGEYMMLRGDDGVTGMNISPAAGQSYDDMTFQVGNLGAQLYVTASGVGFSTGTSVKSIETSTSLSTSNTTLSTTGAIKSYVDTAVAGVPVGDITNISVTSPITGGGSSGSVGIGIQVATASQNGYLSAANWSTFNSKTSNTGTVTGVTFNGNAFSASGSTTVTIAPQGSSSQYVNGAGNLTTFPSIPQGDITAVVAGNKLTGGGTSGSVTLGLASNNISQWTNDSGYTTNAGDITSVTAGNKLTGGGTSGAVTLGLASNNISQWTNNASYITTTGTAEQFFKNNLFLIGSSNKFKLGLDNTDQPQARLDLRDSVNDSTGMRFSTVNTGDNDYMALYFNGTAAGSGFEISRKNTGGAEMIFQSDGDIALNGRGSTGAENRVAIGHTQPTSKLHLKSAPSGVPAARFEQSSTGTGQNNTVLLLERANLPSSGARTMVIFRDQNWTSGNFSGNISSNLTSTAYNTGSDERLKEDFKDFDGLSIAMDIPVYDFAWKDQDNRGLGCKAQEVQKILPEAITGDVDKGDYLTMDYSKLVPVLLKSIQELQERITILEGNN